MAAKKKAAKAAEPKEVEAPKASSKVAAVSSDEPKNVYDLSLGESLPAQKKAGE